MFRQAKSSSPPAVAWELRRLHITIPDDDLVTRVACRKNGSRIPTSMFQAGVRGNSRGEIDDEDRRRFHLRSQLRNGTEVKNGSSAAGDAGTNGIDSAHDGARKLCPGFGAALPKMGSKFSSAAGTISMRTQTMPFPHAYVTVMYTYSTVAHDGCQNFYASAYNFLLTGEFQRSK